MKRKTLLMLALVLISLSAATQNTYQKVKIHTNQTGIQQLVNAGYNLDHAHIEKNRSVICVLKESSIQEIQDLGFDVSVEINDVSTFYSDRAINDPLHPFQLKNAGCNLGAGSVDPNNKYDTPDNFSLGSYAGFFTYQEFLDNLDSMASKYPNLITVKQPIGTFQTHQGRPIYWVKISDNPNTDETEPETLYSAIHHAREPASLSQLIFYMWHMLENYNTDPEVQYLIDETEMYFVPILNPDGYIINENNDPNGGGMWRKNARDNNNNSTLDGDDGVDLNRNYDYQFGVSGVSSNIDDDTYPGPNGFSEPETQAMKWFCEQHEFNFALNAHTYGNLLLFPFGYANSAYAADHDYFQAVSNHMVKENNYVAQKSSDLYPAAGDSDDWMYDGDLGTKPKIYAMTPEIGSDNDGFYPQPSRILPICKDNVFQNKRNAHVLKNYATVKETGDQRVEQTSGYFYYTIQRLGLESGSFDVSITPLTGIASVGNANTHTGMAIMDVENDSISYTLNGSIGMGDEIKFVLHLDNGALVFNDTITKVYGAPNAISIDPIDNISNWTTTGQWSITANEYYSANYSITDSPNGSYNNSSSSTVTHNTTFDLTNSTQALVSFYAKWDIEDNYDFVVFEVSTDNGNNWIPQCGNYTNIGTANQIQGKPLYDGIQSDWVFEEIDLSDYIGQNIMFRFRFDSDLFVSEDGFYFDDFTVSADGVTSIAEEEFGSFKMYPNPAQNQVQIFSQNNTISSIHIYDQTGKIVKHVSSRTQKSVFINTSELSKGLYLVEIRDASGQRQIQKLIIQ